MASPSGSASIPITYPCWVDTGFSGGILLPSTLEAAVRQLGIKGQRLPVGLAGDVRSLANAYLGYLSKIDGFAFATNTIPVPVLFMGTSKYGLVGLNLIKDWISEFHGPNKVLTISENNSQA